MPTIAASMGASFEMWAELPIQISTLSPTPAPPSSVATIHFAFILTSISLQPFKRSSFFVAHILPFTVPIIIALFPLQNL